MTLTIPRHDVSRPMYAINAKKFPEERARQAGRLEKTAKSASSALDSVYMDSLISLAVDPRAAQLETWRSWTTSMQIAHALFAVSTVPEGTVVECLIDQKTRHLTATGPRYFTNAGNWLRAFFLAITCRDEQRWEELCHIPVELLREAGESKGTRRNPYIYHWVSALQAYILNRPEFPEELAKAMELSDPQRADIGSPEMLNKLVFPPMNTLLKFAQGDSDAFNESLAKGVRLFRDYHTSDEERAKRIDGAAPLSLLALACMGYDRSSHEAGFRLEVESDYLPKHIVERSWYGEFDI